MTHQIYYTSAPNGLKRGASGFCTVAASDNIPRALWDRLETLSAYRHHFPANSAAPNPVSFAHWLLNVAGTSYHVLSRVADSGMDHTQRTNAFAHHLVLDAAEIAAAPAGPASLLLHPGVMATAWDGNVGTLPQLALPRGDVRPAVCHGWEAATGDAGWAGHLADLFTKSPAKPVCVVFSPGQEILPLIAEAVALLPPQARWQVTFNSYFTSMPTSATCAWRCVLADTPAAVTGLRYASGGSGGLVIDLTDKSRMGRAPDGPYATLARTGQPPASLRKSPPVKSVTPSAARPRPAAGQPPAASPPTPQPPAPLEDELSTYDFAEIPVEPAAVEVAAPPPVPVYLQPAARRNMPRIRQSDTALEQAQREAATAAGRRRRQVLALFGSALAALAVGSVLVIALLRNGQPPEIAPVTTHPRAQAPPPAPVIIATAPAVEVTATQAAPPVETQPAVAPVAVTPLPHPVEPPTRFPAIVTLSAPLEFPEAGTSLGDREQHLTYRRFEIHRPAQLTERILFPNGKYEYPVDAPAKGMFISTPPIRRGAQNVMALKWKDTSEMAVASVAWGPGGKVEVLWHSTAMVKRPEIVRLAYWLLQSSSIELQGNLPRNQQAVFKQADAPPIDFDGAGGAIKAAGPFPAEAQVAAPANLPPGWQVDWYRESKDGVLKDPATESQVLKFHKPGSSAALESWFTLTFSPGLTSVESSYAKRAQADESDMQRAQSDLRALVANIRQLQTDGGLKDGDEQLKPYLAKKEMLTKLADGYKAAAAGYKELQNFDVPVQMAGGLKLAALHFERAAKPAPGKN